MKSDTLVIIPAFNEEKNIREVVQAIKILYPSLDVVVINDGSTDETALRANEAGALVLSHPFNMGYGVSLQTGYKYAVQNDYKYLIQIDGDGQHDPRGIENMLNVIRDDSADVVLGSRFIGNNSYKTSIFRMTGIFLFRFILKLLSGKHIKDITTGFQAMNRKVLNLFITDVFPCDYPDADVILLLSRLGYRIKEVPVVMYSKTEGKSMHSNPIKVFYYIFKMILSMFLTKLRKY